MFYFKHPYTSIVYFEKEKNLLSAVKDALMLAEREAKEGIKFTISIGVVSDPPPSSYNSDYAKCYKCCERTIPRICPTGFVLE